MSQRVESTAADLFHGQSLGQVAVEHGKGVECSEERLLELLLLVGNYGSIIMLGSCA